MDGKNSTDLHLPGYSSVKQVKARSVRGWSHICVDLLLHASDVALQTRRIEPGPQQKGDLPSLIRRAVLCHMSGCIRETHRLRQRE